VGSTEDPGLINRPGLLVAYKPAVCSGGQEVRYPAASKVRDKLLNSIVNRNSDSRV
jgi:hypothetical protein